MRTSPLLLSEPPLQVLPTLAVKIGLNEAIVLQQLHYWLINNQRNDKRDHFVDDRWWAFGTYENWQQRNFPFWSWQTVRRAFVSLEKLGLILIGNFNRDNRDRTKWYTILYDAVDALWNEVEATSESAQEQTEQDIQSNLSDCKNANYQDDKMPSSNLSDCKNANYQDDKNTTYQSDKFIYITETNRDSLTETSQQERVESKSRKSVSFAERVRSNEKNESGKYIADLEKLVEVGIELAAQNLPLLSIKLELLQVAMPWEIKASGPNRFDQGFLKYVSQKQYFSGDKISGARGFLSNCRDDLTQLQKVADFWFVYQEQQQRRSQLVDVTRQRFTSDDHSQTQSQQSTAADADIGDALAAANKRKAIALWNKLSDRLQRLGGGINKIQDRERFDHAVAVEAGNRYRLWYRQNHTLDAETFATLQAHLESDRPLRRFGDVARQVTLEQRSQIISQMLDIAPQALDEDQYEKLCALINESAAA